jgi:hypothetical protein
MGTLISQGCNQQKTRVLKTRQMTWFLKENRNKTSDNKNEHAKTPRKISEIEEIYTLKAT